MARNRLDPADDSITASINSLLKAVEDEIKTIRQAIETVSRMPLILITAANC